MKKSTVIIISLVILAALGGGIYFAYLKSKQILNPPPANTTSSLSLAGNAATSTLTAAPLQISEQAKALGLSLVTQNPVFDYWVESTKGKGNSVKQGTTSSETIPSSLSTFSLFYVNLKGQIAEIQDGVEEMVSSREIPNLAALYPSPDGHWAILESNDGTNKTLQLFDAQTHIWKNLPTAAAISFSPDSKSIVYLQTQTAGKQNLVVQSLGSKSQSKTIASLALADSNLYWIEQNKILFASKPSASYDGEAWLYDMKAGIMTMLVHGNGLMASWDSRAATGMLARTVNNALELQLFDVKGDILGQFNVSTLPSKCAFGSSAALYCAIPSGYSIKSPTLPDDYLKGGAYSSDFLYRFNLITNDSMGIILPAERIFDMQRLAATADKILFVSRYDNGLYALPLQ